jgi:hypothetical protein
VNKKYQQFVQTADNALEKQAAGEAGDHKSC